jgi:hypothetical protein
MNESIEISQELASKLIDTLIDCRCQRTNDMIKQLVEAFERQGVAVWFNELDQPVWLFHKPAEDFCDE